MSRDQKIIIGIVGVIILAIVGSALFFLSSGKNTQQGANQTIEEEVVPTIVPDELGLSVEARADNKAVKFIMTKIAGIKSVDYEITYTASVSTGGNAIRGINGTIDVEPGDNVIESEYHDLGTCSSGKCKYDEGVTKVDFLFKITKTDGKVFSSQTSLELE